VKPCKGSVKPGVIGMKPKSFFQLEDGLGVLLLGYKSPCDP
jgi:hypothetical protein